jgi:hypothetical protein
MPSRGVFELLCAFFVITVLKINHRVHKDSQRSLSQIGVLYLKASKVTCDNLTRLRNYKGK